MSRMVFNAVTVLIHNNYRVGLTLSVNINAYNNDNNKDFY